MLYGNTAQTGWVACATAVQSSDNKARRMLTDIFAIRYEDRLIWASFGTKEKRLLIQGWGVMSDSLPPIQLKSPERVTEAWQTVHDLLARELGMRNLSATRWTSANGASYGYKIDKQCENFVCAKFEDGKNPDSFIKRRLSLVEIVLRTHGERLMDEIDRIRRLAAPNEVLADPDKLRTFVPIGLWLPTYETLTRQIDAWKLATHELNERFKQAGAPVSYNDGYIQLVTDELIEKHVEKPFWLIASDPKWKNVSIDMNEALDLRDSGAKDPAYHAAKALESVIKIISDDKQWTSGNEKGAANYIDNLVSQKNGKFIHPWEADILKEYFKKVRNPMGHGSGSSEMPVLTKQQCDWAIENAMSWSRALIDRL